MTRGLFDKTAVNVGWFDETAQPVGWFDETLLDVTAGGVNYTLSGAAGSYTLTGNAAAFKANYALSGAAGSYALTGIAATLSYSPGSGAYSLTGDAGSYVLTGKAASFAVNRYLQGSSGSYALTGNAATLTYTPGSSTQNYTLSGASGSYVLTGREAAFAFSGAVQRPVVFINRNVENDPDKVKKVIRQYFDEYEFLYGAIPDKEQIFNAIVMQLQGNESRKQLKKLVNSEIEKHFERIAEDEDEESLLMLM